MASVIETGHAKNIANLDEMITRCIHFGAAYNPADASIQIAALQGKSVSSKSAAANLKNAKTVLDNASNAREILFGKLRPLATRMVNAFEAARASAQSVEDLKTVNRKLTGKRAPGKNKRLAAPPVAVVTSTPSGSRKLMSSPGSRASSSTSRAAPGMPPILPGEGPR